ncbi:MAG: M48 family metalloprotease [Myxococcota bacterium]
MRRYWGRVDRAAGALGVLAITFLATGSCDEGGIGALFISDQQEVELGQGVDEQIEMEFPIATVDDPAATWARQVVAPLVDASAQFRDPQEIAGYEVEVIADDELVNAFAAPGGYIYISTGLVLQASRCGELAGVLGHELAHVTERHGVEAMGRAIVAGTVADIFLEDGSLAEGAAAIAFDLLISRPNSRSNEREADEVGVQITHDAGYNPYGLVGFFQLLLEQQSGGAPPDFLSTHPTTQDRIDDTTALIESLYGDEVNPQGTQTYDCLGTEMMLEEVQQHIQQGVSVKPGTGQGRPEGDGADGAS